jgi:hypothetical protein
MKSAIQDKRLKVKHDQDRRSRQNHIIQSMRPLGKCLSSDTAVRIAHLFPERGEIVMTLVTEMGSINLTFDPDHARGWCAPSRPSST